MGLWARSYEVLINRLKYERLNYGFTVILLMIMDMSCFYGMDLIMCPWNVHKGFYSEYSMLLTKFPLVQISNVLLA